MKINISKEYLRFEKEKQEKRKIYDNLNMNVEQIEQIEAIDKKIFRNDINYNAHNIPLYSGDYEYEEKNMEQKSIVSHIKNIYEEMDYIKTIRLQQEGRRQKNFCLQQKYFVVIAVSICAEKVEKVIPDKYCDITNVQVIKKAERNVQVRL